MSDKDTSQIDNQIQAETGRYKKKAPSRGGARKNSGRKAGSTQKISGATILAAIQKECGTPFETLLAEGYHDSIVNHDKQTRLQYEKMFLSKVVADKVEVDHTTLGASLNANFNFPTKELPDWTSIPVTITTVEK